MSQPQVPPIKPGDGLTLSEPDYMYGAGILHLRVTKVGPVQQLQDGEWIDLEGLTLRSDGTQVDVHPRHALVRVSALRSGLRRAPGKSS